MRFGIPVLAAILGLVVGFGAGFVYQQRAVESVEAQNEEQVQEVADLLHQLEDAEGQVAERQAEVELLRSDIEQVTADRDDLMSEIENVREELEEREMLVDAERERSDQLERDLERLNAQTEEMEELADALWQDRRLLEELNRNFPDDEDEFLEYVERLADLAVRSHPDLQEEADNVVASVPDYLGWQQELTELEINLLLNINAGAREFTVAYRVFEQSVLRAVIERMEHVIEQI